jgi:hypothetical protein
MPETEYTSTMGPVAPDILSEFLDYAYDESNMVSETKHEEIEYVVALSKIAGAAEFVKRITERDIWYADTTNLNTK